MFSISGLCWNADKLIWLISSRVFVTFDAITTPLVKQFFGAHDSFEFLVDTIVSAIIRNSSWLGLLSCMDKLRKSFPFGLSRKPCLQKPHIPQARKISASEYSSFVAKIPRNCRLLAVFYYVKYVSVKSWPLTPKYRATALSCFHLMAVLSRALGLALLYCIQGSELLGPDLVCVATEVMSRWETSEC